jgi:lipopolysaccharide/colanic/teichoic acid biosynthesis glycosyltransferase
MLRRFKLDEIPQLFQVVSGTMSLVGRRPEDPCYVALYTPEQLRVLDVLPALTGPAMVVNEELLLVGLGPNEVEQRYIHEIMPKKILMELEYLDSWSPLGDLKILLATIRALVRAS